MGASASAEEVPTFCCKTTVTDDASPVVAVSSQEAVEEELPTLLRVTGVDKQGNKLFVDDANADVEIVDMNQAMSPHASEDNDREVAMAPTDCQTDAQALAEATAPIAEEVVAAAAPPPPKAEADPAATAVQAPPQRSVRTREERKERRRQQRNSAKERLQPFLTKHGFAGPNSVRRRFFKSQYPIHYAAIQNNVEVVKLLIIAGVDITKKDSRGLTAHEHARREHAKRNSHTQVLALLTEAQRRRTAKLARRHEAAQQTGPEKQENGQRQQQQGTGSSSSMHNISTGTSTATDIEGGVAVA
eukprot:TRINITY_DN16445_c0_g1_i1.p1 TRINITY_DN16445_c0_g1~~TRINITY_DN16445_c0_g1_i1.p1  ORF type:complete len:302 (-),score=80.98 TRINITY_DN16445_c0_g1_i1:295-1200(-)